MSSYELVFIIRPDVATEQVEKATAKVVDLVKSSDGKVVKNEQWGLRSLAYRIKKHRKGYYVMLGLDIDGSKIAEIERTMRLSDDIIRFLTIKVDEVSQDPSPMMKNRKPHEMAAVNEA